MLIGYARVSTLDQNPQLQLDALRAAGCGRIFEEKLSAAVQRPQLEAALSFMREGDTLVVWRLDRLARSLKQLLDTVDILKNQNIGFQSITERIDTTTATGRLVFHLFGALAEFERGLIRDRTVAGLNAARARGRVGGRPAIMNEQRLMTAQALLKDGRLTVAEVASQVGVSDGTLYRHLPRPRSTVTLSE